MTPAVTSLGPARTARRPRRPVAANRERRYRLFGLNVSSDVDLLVTPEPGLESAAPDLMVRCADAESPVPAVDEDQRGASLAGGEGHIPGTLVGALLMAVLRNGGNLLNVPPFWQQFIIGAMIIVAVLYDHLRRRGA